MDTSEKTLRSLALHDEHALSVLFSGDNVWALTAREAALVRLAVLIALESPVASYQSAVDQALGAGATIDDMVGTLRTVASLVGSARVVAAAPALALAVGYDIDAALEGHGQRTRPV